MTQGKQAWALSAIDDWWAAVSGYQRNTANTLANSIRDFWSGASARGKELAAQPANAAISISRIKRRAARRCWSSTTKR